MRRQQHRETPPREAQPTHLPLVYQSVQGQRTVFRENHSRAHQVYACDLRVSVRSIESNCWSGLIAGGCGVRPHDATLDRGATRAGHTPQSSAGGVSTLALPSRQSNQVGDDQEFAVLLSFSWRLRVEVNGSLGLGLEECTSEQLSALAAVLWAEEALAVACHVFWQRARYKERCCGPNHFESLREVLASF